jgi:hypothetical protein
MGLKKFALIIFLMIVAGFPALAQRDSVGLIKLVSKTEKLSIEHPFEKVYLHFDKPYYAIGDTIWFKAYLTIGARHQPSGLSRIIYVDLINSRDSIIKSLKLPGINGVAFGDIILSRELFKQGNYHIRAYTNWMRNFGPDYFFNKNISIGDAADNTTDPKISYVKTKKNNVPVINARMIFKDRDGNPYADKKVNWTVQNQGETIRKGRGTTDHNGVLSITISSDQSVLSNAAILMTTIDLGNKESMANSFPLKSVFATADVQFFPEGGELITGIRSKVAFKAVNPDGKGVDITGTLTDDAGAEVTSFNSVHAGMGIFALLPESGKSYKATVTFPDGSKNTYDLPNVRTDGINIAVNNNDPENLNIKVAANAAYFKQYQNKSFYIIAQSGGTIYYTALVGLQSLVYTGSVAKSKFPTGILQVTLFAANGEPLSERIVFIQHNDALNLSLMTNVLSYNARQNVKMTFSAKNRSLPVEGSFSVAVIDETKVPFDEDAETTILSSLLLTSDLRGYIEKPGYYFNHADKKAISDLDILMLTQGYRRFSYADLMADKYPPVKFSPEKGIVVSGTLRTSMGLPVFKGNVNLRLPSRNISVNGLTDADGHFIFSNVSIFDSSKVVLSARNNASSGNMMIIADRELYQPVTKNMDDPDEITDIDSTLSEYLQNSKKQIENSHVLKEVVIKGTRPVKLVHPNYTTLTGLSMEADQNIGPDRLKYCSFVLTDCIQTSVVGLRYADQNFYIERDYLKGNRKPVQFFVNGLGVDYNYLTTIDPTKVQLIEVYYKDGVSGINRLYDCDGIISITTNGGNFSKKDETNDLQPLTGQSSEVTIMPKGFYRARMFYAPKYDHRQNASEQATDLRTTIYWNPNIITDKDGNASFEYNNADGRGTYRAVIEGIDNDGNIGRYVLRYNVK